MSEKIMTLAGLREISAFSGSTKGTMLVARFRNAVLAGTVPSQDDLKALAYALEALEIGFEVKTSDENKKRDALTEFGNRLGLKKKQGKSAIKIIEWEAATKSVWRYSKRYEREIKSGKNEKDAKKISLEGIANDEKIGTKAMQNRIDKYSSYISLWEDIFSSEYRKLKNFPPSNEKDELMNSVFYRELAEIYEP